MRRLFVNLHFHACRLREERGQDLIEYALVAALIALAATAGMSSVASAINNAFVSIGSKLTTYTS